MQYKKTMQGGNMLKFHFQKWRQNPWFKRFVLLSVIGLLLCFALLGYANYAISRCGDAVYSSVSDVPSCEYGLLLGTAKIVQKKYLKQYFQ